MTHNLTATTLVIAALSACERPRPAAQEASSTAASTASTPAAPQPVVARTIGSVPPGAAPEITVGTTVNGTLETGDQVLSDQSLGDDFGITLTLGQPITIVTRGAPVADGGVLDVQTVLLFNGQEVVSDDDSARNGASLNSRIVFSPMVTGFYVIRVTTSGPGTHTGSYTLQTYPGGLLRQL